MGQERDYFLILVHYEKAGSKNIINIHGDFDFDVGVDDSLGNTQMFLMFVCLFVQFRSHTKVCLVLDCDLIVARGKEGEGREGERERVCVCLYGGMYVCVAAWLRGCVAACCAA